MNEIKQINYLKAFSSILVVLFHALIETDVCYESMFYLRTTLALDKIHVPLFILLAGYLCHKQPVKSFYWKKIKKILIPFLFMTCLKLICSNFILDDFTHGESFWEQMYRAFLCGELYWFCYCILLLFFLAPLLWNHKLRLWILLGATVIANTVLQITETTLPDFLQLSKVLQMFPLFLIGMLLAEYSAAKKITKKSKNWQLLAAAVLAAVCIWLRFHVYVDNIYLLDLLLGLSVMYLLLFLAEKLPAPDHIFGKFLTKLGHYSLQIMLLDAFYRVFLFWVLGRWIANGIWLVLLVTVLDIVLSFISCELIKKIPFVPNALGLS